MDAIFFNFPRVYNGDSEKSKFRFGLVPLRLLSTKQGVFRKNRHGKL